MSLKAYSQGSKFPPTKPGVLRIYSMRFCPFAERTRLVLEHKKIPYETVNINLKSKPDWFLEKNPAGLVPVLELDGRVLPESTATCEWLDGVHPEPSLRQEDPFIRAWDIVLMENFGKLRGTFYRAWAADKQQLPEIALERLGYLDWYEARLAERAAGPFFGGSKPTMIDFMLWPTFERIPSQVEFVGEPGLNFTQERHPRLHAWAEAMTSLPAVQAIAFTTAQRVEYRKTVASGKPNYDMFLD